MIYILIPTYNNEQWLKRCLDSVAAQHGMIDYRVHIIDDASTDDSSMIIRNYIDSRPNLAMRRIWSVHTNEVNQKCPRNLYEGIARLGAQPEDVILIVDGDDYIPEGVVQRLWEVYQDDYIWLTYGNFKTVPHKQETTRAHQYPNHIIRNRAYRQWGGIAFNHPISFRKLLWDGITPQDLQTADGEWFTAGYDQAIMLPLLELATPEHEYPHFQFLDEILYCYNTINPISDVLVSTEAADEVRQVWNREPKAPL